MDHYLITGGAGFIGSNLVEELLKQGEKVRVLDNFSTGRRDNLKPFINDIELIEGDIRSLSTVYRAVDGIDFVLHQAALPSVQRSVEDPITTNEVNITGTLNLLIASSITSFSIAPPPTVPDEAPSLFINILNPTFPGAEPLVLTTVAITKGWLFFSNSNIFSYKFI